MEKPGHNVGQFPFGTDNIRFQLGDIPQKVEYYSNEGQGNKDVGSWVYRLSAAQCKIHWILGFAEVRFAHQVSRSFFRFLESIIYEETLIYTPSRCGSKRFHRKTDTDDAFRKKSKANMKDLVAQFFFSIHNSLIPKLTFKTSLFLAHKIHF